MLILEGLIVLAKRNIIYPYGRRDCIIHNHVEKLFLCRNRVNRETNFNGSLRADYLKHFLPATGLITVPVTTVIDLMP